MARADKKHAADRGSTGAPVDGDPEPEQVAEGKRRLLDAADALLSEVGPSALSLREVARRAGVSHAAPYNHFENKQALLVELALDGWHRLDRSMADAQAMAPASPIEQFLACGLGYVQFAVRNPAAYKLMTQSEYKSAVEATPLEQATRVGFDRLVDLIRAVREERGLSMDEGEVMRDCLLSWAQVHGLALLSIDARVDELAPDDLGPFRAVLLRLKDLF